MESTLTFLGRDSGFGDKNNSAYVELDGKLVIIDCGFTVFQDVKNKFDFNRYEEIEIIITHLHNDHAGSLSQLILYLWFNYNKKVTILSKCKYIREYLDITGTPMNSYELKEGLENLKFIETKHGEYLDAYGFSLNIKNKNILYTGDTETIEPFLPYLNDIDEFYVDVSRYGGIHIKIDDIIGKLKEIEENGTRVFLMHMDDIKYIQNVTENVKFC